MLNYYDCFKNTNGAVYSIDMLRFKFYCTPEKMYLLRGFISNIADCDVYQSAKSFAYNVLLKVHIHNSVYTFAVGLGFNGLKSSEKTSCFIEFNPNRVGRCKELIRVLEYLTYLHIQLELSVYDIAIDIPISKKYVSLVKDKRVYKKFVYDCAGVNCTEYLGSTSDYGRVKLYNKTIESELDYDLTRLELSTNSIDYLVVSRQLPQILVCGNLGLPDCVKLSKSDYVLLQLLWLCDSPSYYFKQLGKDKQVKLKPFLNSNFVLGFNEHIFTYLLKIIDKFKNI